MDWTGWLLIGVILVAWVLPQWAFSLRRGSEKIRGRNREAADGMLEVERDKARGGFWTTFGG
ncbi:hypothetical protein [Agromyces sp. NPDC058126]|uniref:hypothetical protein n=1 Tax=Agromyces sp. NPDC058126 TaxID=3346350 RepID=UPI0036DE380A